MTKFGNILWWLFVFEQWKDGDGYAFIFNKWNPLTWILFLPIIVAYLVIGGVGLIKQEWDYNKFNFRYSKYWTENKSDIIFLKRKG